MGLGGLAWGIGGYVVLTLWGKVYLSPYPCIGMSPLGLLGKGRDRGQGRLVEGERGRERERER